jgi:hypothetical protein
MSLQNIVGVGKKRGNVAIKLGFHGTVKGTLSDISRSEFEITTKILWKKVRIVVPRRYVVLLEFAEEGGG